MKTTHEYRGYVFTVTYEAKDPAYVVDFSDIPDIITSGGTLGEAFSNVARRSICIWKACRSSASEFPSRSIAWLESRLSNGTAS